MKTIINIIRKNSFRGCALLLVIFILGQSITPSVAAPGGAATLTAALAVDNNSNGLVEPGDTLRYTATLTNSGDADLAGVVFTELLDINTTLVGGSINVSPLAFNDNYSAVGNTWLEVGGTPSGLPAVTAAGSVLDNDIEVLPDTFSITGYTATSTNGGTVILNTTTGSFRYLPAAGFSGKDTFTYTLTDSKGLTDTGTVTINVGQVVWYVKNDVTTGDGRSGTPFKELVSAQTASASGSVIYVYYGDGTSSQYNAGITLKTNQILMGQAEALSVDGHLLVPAGSKPTLGNTGGGVVSMASGCEVLGLTIAATNGVGISATGGTTQLKVRNVNINGSGSGGGISLTSLIPPITISDGAIVNSGSLPAVAINGGGSPVTFTTFPISQTGNGRAVDISNRTGGTVSFGAGSPVTKSSGSGDGIFMNSNSGATVSFSEPITLTTSGSPGLNVVSGGTLLLSGTTNSITSSNAAALILNGSPSGINLGSGATFSTVTANTSTTNGILINNVTGGITINNGVIQNITQSGISIANSNTISLKNISLTSANTTRAAGCAEDNSSACYAALKLNQVNGITLTNLTITNAAQTGINGEMVGDFTLTNSTISNSGGAVNEDGIDLRNLSGTNSITNTNISGSYDRHLYVRNTSQSFTALNISGSSFQSNNNPNGRQGALVHFPPGATGSGLVDVSNSYFYGNVSAGLQFANEGSNTLSARVLNNTGTNKGFKNNEIGVNLVSNFTGTLYYNVAGNEFNNDSQAVNVDIKNASISNGRINNNSITSSASYAIPIWVVQEGNGSGVVEINGNSISRFGEMGIDVETRGGTGRVDATIKNNTVNHGGSPNPAAGVYLQSGNGAPGETNRMCANLSGNTVDAGGNMSVVGDYYLDRFSPSTTQFFIQSLVPSPVDVTIDWDSNAVGTFIDNQNTGLDTYWVETGQYLASPGNCLQPSFTLESPGMQVAGLVNEMAAREGAEFPVIFTALDHTEEGESQAVHLEKQIGATGLETVSGATIEAINHLVPVVENNSRGPGLATLPAAGETVSVTIGTLQVGKTVKVTFDAQVNNPLPPGVTQVSTQGRFSGSNFIDILSDDPASPAVNDPTVTLVNVKADLSLAKSDGGVTTKAVGDVVVYSLTYNNVGPDGAGSVEITETVPANTVFNSANSTPGWSCADASPAGTTCKLTVGNLVKDANGTVMFAVRVTATLPAGVTQIANSATISSPIIDPVSDNNTASDTTPVSAAPDLRLGKNDGDVSFLPGQVISYTLSYSNAGTQGATGVVITETVPVNSTFNQASSTGTWSCASGSTAGTSCTQTIGAVNAGASGSTVFAVQAVSGGAYYNLLSNAASIADDGVNGEDLTSTDNTATDTTPRLNLAPTLTNLMVSSGTLNENGSVTLSANVSGPEEVDTLTVTINWGDGTAVETLNLAAGTLSFSQGHTYLDDNPSGTAFDINSIQVTVTDDKSASTPGSVNATVNNVAPVVNAGADKSSGILVAVNFNGSFTDPGTLDTHTIQWDFGDGSPMVTGTLTPTHTFTSEGTYTVTLKVTDDDTGMHSDTLQIGVTANADLTLSKSDGGITTAAAGGVVVYTLSYSNLGPDPGVNTVIIESVPAYTTFNAGSSTAGWSCADNSPAGTSCEYSIPILAKDAGGVVNFAVNISASLPAGVDQISNNAVIQSSLYDPTPANSNASDTTPISAAPDLKLTKSTTTTSFLPGETIAFTLGYSNVGTQNATGVVITETVPLNSAFNAVGSTTGWSCADGAAENTTCTLSVGSLAASANGSVTFVVKAATGGAYYGQISNTASIADDGANGADLAPSDNTATKSVSRTNLPPTLTNLVISTPVDENGTVTISADVSGPESIDSLTVTIDWKDGSPNTVVNLAPGVSNFSETHQYLDDNPTGTTQDQYAVGVTIKDQLNASTSGSVNVLVKDVAPVVNAGGDQTATTGVPKSFNGSFTDVGTLDTHTISWNFGDGSPASTGSLTPSHTYAAPGVYNVTLTVTDDDTLVGTSTIQVTVASLADLEIIELNAPTEVLVNTELIYVLKVTNKGPSTANGISVVDTLPAGVTYVPGSPDCTHLSGVVTCLLPPMGKGVINTFIIQTKVNPSASGVLTNQAVVSSATSDLITTNNTVTSNSTVVNFISPYSSNFSSAPGSEWSSPKLTTAPNGQVFLGEFGNGPVNLTLNNLREHKQIMLIFDLYILRSWDGNTVNLPSNIMRLVNPDRTGEVIGPDIWELRADGQNVLVHTTFSNWLPLGFKQAYPGTYPGGDFPALTGASSFTVLGYKFKEVAQDAVYHMVLVFPHTSSSLSLDFLASGLQSIDDESWGLDNVQVRLLSDTAAYPYRYYMPEIDR